MASSVLREIEELRHLLDTPRKTFSPLKTLDNITTPRAVPEAMKTYSTALNSAEKSVDRLGRAIEAAEEEMDAALKRTTEVHRSQLKQKELEVLELQRVIGAKERSIDSLRDTLGTTKRTYESRMSQLESALTLKDAEIKALSEELRVSRMERDSTSMQLERAEAGRRAIDSEAREREHELSSAIRLKTEEATKAAMALRYEKKEKDELRHAMDDLRRQVVVLDEQLRLQKDETLLVKERYEAELEEMRKRLRSERNLRKACEKWLRSELKSREEMELLLSAVKDAATGRAPVSDVAEVEALIDHLRAGKSNSPSPRSPRGGGGGGRSPHRLGAARGAAGAVAAAAAGAAVAAGGGPSRSAEIEAVRRKLEEDNQRLRSELLAARKVLSERLKYT